LLIRELRHDALHTSTSVDDFTDRERILISRIKFRGLSILTAFAGDWQSVSRKIIHKTAGTATVFAFDEGQGLSEHTAPFDALVHVFDGEAEIVIAGKHVPMKAGEIIIMPAHQPHALKATKRFKMLLVMIRNQDV
jgi:quercetin dioxygenase-like cupin family protein